MLKKIIFTIFNILFFINSSAQIKKNKKYEVIDLYSLFANENGLMIKELSTDGIHLNEKGYQKWVEFIKPIVYSLE